MGHFISCISLLYGSCIADEVTSVSKHPDLVTDSFMIRE